MMRFPIETTNASMHRKESWFHNTETNENRILEYRPTRTHIICNSRKKYT